MDKQSVTEACNNNNGYPVPEVKNLNKQKPGSSSKKVFEGLQRLTSKHLCMVEEKKKT